MKYRVNRKHLLYFSTKLFSYSRLSELPVIMFCSLHMKESCACGKPSAKTTLLKMTCYNILVGSRFIILLFSVTFILKKNTLIQKISNSLAKQVGSTQKVLPVFSRSCFLPSIDWREKCRGAARGDMAMSLWHAWAQHSKHFMYGGYLSFTLK